MKAMPKMKSAERSVAWAVSAAAEEAVVVAAVAVAEEVVVAQRNSMTMKKMNWA